MSVIYDEQARDESFAELAADILRCAVSELYLNMRYLDVALSSLALVPDQGIREAGTDGRRFFFDPDSIARRFRIGRIHVNRLYLHSVFHCLFAHLWLKDKRDSAYWDLACDIAVERTIDGLDCRALHRPPNAVRRELYQALRKESKALSAQRIYAYLLSCDLSEEQFALLSDEFRADDHSRWENESGAKAPSSAEKNWQEARERMQSEINLTGPEASGGSDALTEQLGELEKKPVDYRDFLRKFSVLGEEMQPDPDSFDYIYYNYGMELYGNMPLIEPLETREVKKIEDFVIVLDTSMSCRGEVLRRFLEETYSILSESESFFREINLHILQCDDRVEEDVTITDRRGMEAYLQDFTVRGYGGTDFRPAFARVEELLAEKRFTKLRGLIYFTDGYGIFPHRKPPYDTAFVFLKEQYRDVDVPPWAIKLIINEEDIMRSDMPDEEVLQ